MLKEIVKTLGSYKFLSEPYHRYRLSKETKKKGRPIIIHQMGKVGSTSIYEELKKQVPDSPLYHTHFLSQAGIHDAKLRLRELEPRSNANAWCLLESEVLRDLVDSHPAYRSVDIISLVRDPMARNISSYFYNIKKYMPDFFIKYQSGEINYTDIMKNFMELFSEHEMPGSWFDQEMKTVFDIDIYRSQFDYEKGYSILENKGHRLLLLRLDLLKSNSAPAFGEFLGISNFSLNKSNTSEEQPYIDVYKKFLNEAKFPNEYLDRIYGSRLCEFFYSPKDLDHMRKKWEGTT